MFHSIVFLDVYPSGIEWTVPKILKNLTQNEYDKLINDDLNSRRFLFDLINGIGKI
jgi:hypothetical protein